MRVSTQEQNEARQLAAMQQFGIEERDIVIEKISGKDCHRPRYQRLVKALHPGDVLVVKSIDRLGRNYDEILEQWSTITKKRQAEGIAEAKARGGRFGPPPQEMPECFEELRQAWQSKQMTLRAAASRNLRSVMPPSGQSWRKYKNWTGSFTLPPKKSCKS